MYAAGATQTYTDINRYSGRFYQERCINLCMPQAQHKHTIYTSLLIEFDDNTNKYENFDSW